MDSLQESSPIITPVESSPSKPKKVKRQASKKQLAALRRAREAKKQRKNERLALLNHPVPKVLPDVMNVEETVSNIEQHEEKAIVQDIAQTGVTVESQLLVPPSTQTLGIGNTKVAVEGSGGSGGTVEIEVEEPDRKKRRVASDQELFTLHARHSEAFEQIHQSLNGLQERFQPIQGVQQQVETMSKMLENLDSKFSSVDFVKLNHLATAVQRKIKKKNRKQERETRRQANNNNDGFNIAGFSRIGRK